MGTLWIAPQDGSIKAAETPKIIVPYGQDWWVIERTRYSDEKQPEFALNSNAKNTAVINDLISYPANKSYSNSESIRTYVQRLLPNYMICNARAGCCTTIFIIRYAAAPLSPPSKIRHIMEGKGD